VTLFEFAIIHRAVSEISKDGANQQGAKANAVSAGRANEK